MTVHLGRVTPSGSGVLVRSPLWPGASVPAVMLGTNTLVNDDVVAFIIDDEGRPVIVAAPTDGIGGPAGPPGDPGADGAPGAPGAPGSDGADGAAGPGVAAGGTTDQMLTKASNADYDTQWVDPLTPTTAGLSPLLLMGA